MRALRVLSALASFVGIGFVIAANFSPGNGSDYFGAGIFLLGLSFLGFLLFAWMNRRIEIDETDLTVTFQSAPFKKEICVPFEEIATVERVEVLNHLKILLKNGSSLSIPESVSHSNSEQLVGQGYTSRVANEMKTLEAQIRRRAGLKEI